MASSWWYPTYGHPEGTGATAQLEHDHDSGEVRTAGDRAGPVLRVVDDHVYDCADGTRPIFVIRGTFVYTTQHHPLGEQTPPWFQIRPL